MSLTKNITTDTGFDANYWRVFRIEILIDKKQVEVYLNGYKDKAAWRDGMRALTESRVYLTKDELSNVKAKGLMSKIKAFINGVEGILVDTNESFDSAATDKTDTI